MDAPDRPIHGKQDVQNTEGAMKRQWIIMMGVTVTFGVAHLSGAIPTVLIDN